MAALSEDMRETYYGGQPPPGPLLAECVNPSHADDTASLALYSDHAYCFGCGRRWWPDELQRDSGGHLTIQRARRKAGPVIAPSEEVAKTFAAWLLYGQHAPRLEWLYTRGIRRDAVELNYLGHTGEAFSIPVFDKDGKLLTIRYRRDDGLETDRPKYWGTAGANQTLVYEPQRPEGRPRFLTLLVEGELDALRLAQEGYRAISLTNGAQAVASASNAALLEPFLPLVIVTDQDDAGNTAADVLMKRWPGACWRVRWPSVFGKDVTEFLQRQPLAAFQKRVEAACRKFQ